ncbi:MAG TPA: phosphatidylglycerophosphatase A [Deltaproteobacteria bacterium]|nr:phosphatidylglycerophosphatase A [Deltaproteobacteria bacterium]HCY10335.1 phosphatidylglycerophosphatase A [Deltaproteobacteria bacterium]
MPGTFGTLWGVPIAWLLSGLAIHWQALATIAVIAVSIAVSSEASRIQGTHDHPSIVADEISGYLVGIILLPFTAINAILVFILFRFFDILKPYPVSWLDRRLKGGTGIVLDDLAAGVYANIAAHLVLWLAGKI